MKTFISPMKLSDDNIFFMDETKVDLVEFLTKEMKEQDLLPADITKRSGLSASQVSKILSRESPAGTKALECFSQALGIPYDTLYRYSKNLSKQPDERRNELIHLYDQAKEESREDIIDYAKMRVEKDKREVGKNGKRDRVA